MTAPTIATTVPASNSVGVPTNTTISVTFDQEIDTYRLKNGGIFLEGPDESKALGPGFLDLDPPSTDEDEFLSSPSYKGIKNVTYSFLRVDGEGNEVSYYDYGSGANVGQIYRTKVVLTTDSPLGPLTEYTVYVIGDEDTTDSYDFGLTNRSVFDPIKGANTGNGDVIFYGGYTGATRQLFTVEITTAGVSGVAEYSWSTSTDPTVRTAVTSYGYRILKDGVQIKFLQGLNFAVGDTFLVWCDVPEYMEGSYKFSFTTSSSEAEALPTPSSVLTSTDSSATAFSVSSTTPVDRSAMNSTDLTAITATFSESLNAATITDSTVTVTTEASDGSEDGAPGYEGTITKTLSVSGGVLTITLTEDLVLDNNIVIVTLDSTIADTDGNTLSSDYTFYYGTTYTPYYAGIRAVQLRLGRMGGYFPDETIAFAIWDASREAQAWARTGSGIVNVTGYARAQEQFTICYSAYILLAGGGDSGADSVRKRLGDFDVSRSASSPTEDLKSCVDYYQNVLANGGELNPLFKPENVVKGDYDTDQPHSGRLWEIPTAPFGNARVLYSSSRRWYKTNLGKTGSGVLRTRWTTK